MKKFGFILLFLATVAVIGGSRLWRLYDSEAIYTRQKTDLYLHDTVKLSELSGLLTDSLGVVQNEDDLKWAAHLLGWKTFQPGHYRIDHGFTYDEFLSKLAKGNQDPISITIVPGQSEAKILSFLSNRLQFDSLSVQKVLQDSVFLQKYDIDQKNIIGHFFPSTYDVYWTSSAKIILARIFDEFHAKVADQYQTIAKEHDLSMDEVLALASIVEGEALHNDEKTKISGLYWNRLNRDMPLQADPTVSFALKEQRRLYFKDYKTDSPYNTYTNKGLPPGPINNPSLSSIKAALYPQDHDYLFMVAQPDGYHAFTRTYAEHQRKSKEWRNYLQNQERLKEEMKQDQKNSS